MTAWERAMGLIAELTSLDTGYDCCLTGESAINVIRTALADAERAAYEKAAELAEEVSAESLFQPDLDTSRIIEKLAANIRALAQAGEEA